MNWAGNASLNDVARQRHPDGGVRLEPLQLRTVVHRAAGHDAKVDALSDRLMYRLAYRNFGTSQAMVVNHTVDVGNDQAGIRWYQLSKSGTGHGHRAAGHVRA